VPFTPAQKTRRRRERILTNEIAPTPALMRAGMDALPAATITHGERTAGRFIECFTATIRNRSSVQTRPSQR
jgi:hypothetical protein